MKKLFIIPILFFGLSLMFTYFASIAESDIWIFCTLLWAIVFGFSSILSFLYAVAELEESIKAERHEKAKAKRK